MNGKKQEINQKKLTNQDMTDKWTHEKSMYPGLCDKLEFSQQFNSSDRYSECFTFNVNLLFQELQK